MTTARRGPALRADEARAILLHALAAEGAQVISAELSGAEYREGIGASFCWDVTLDSPTGSVDTYLVVSDASIEPAPGIVTVETEAGDRHIWQYPADPWLPALAGVADDAVAIPGIRQRIGEIEELTTLAYRPLRRAVVAINGRRGRVFAKALLPRKVEEAAERHQLLAAFAQSPAAAISVPEVVSWSRKGLLVLTDVARPSLAERLWQSADPLADPLLDPAGIVAMLRGLPAEIARLSPRVPVADRVSELAAVNSSSIADRWRELAVRIATAKTSLDLGPIVPAHGDLSAANAFPPTTPDEPWAVIDLDTIGPGHLVDDLACLIANAAALPAFDPDRYRAVPSYLQGLLSAFDQAVDRTSLRMRAAAVIVSLASTDDDEMRNEAWFAAAEALLADA